MLLHYLELIKHFSAYAVNHWVQIIAGIVAFEKLASVVVAITPSKADDAILDKVKAVVNALFDIKGK